MLRPPCTVYVIECKTKNHFYTGSTTRRKQKRFDEHRAGYGCKWTGRHGFRRVVGSWSIPDAHSTAWENYLWLHYARIYGPTRVRGGDTVICERNKSDNIPNYLLPVEFGGLRRCDWGVTPPSL